MSVLLFKRFLASPLRVAYILPSSQRLVRKVAGKCDFSKPRVIVELGPGEGCHTREIVRRMHPESRLLLIELDPVLAEHLREQFAHDPRVEVAQNNAAHIKEELQKRGYEFCDYVISGIPFSMFDVPTKRKILSAVYDSLAPDPSSAFVIYQCTQELKRHATMFPRVYSEFCLRNLPPLFVTVYHKQELNGHKPATACACSCGHAHHGVNGHG